MGDRPTTPMQDAAPRATHPASRAGRLAARRPQAAAVASMCVVAGIAAVVAVAVLLGAREAVLVAAAGIGALGLVRPVTSFGGILRARGRVLDTAVLVAVALALVVLSPVAETADVAAF